MNINKKFNAITIIVWVICILFGVFLILKPEISVNIIGYIFGGVILIMGICRIVGSFKEYEFAMSGKFGIINGIINVLIGGFILVRPHIVLSILPVIIGIAVVVESLFKIQTSLAYKRVEYSRWWITFIISILTLILGAILIFNPFATAVITTRLVGIALCVLGAFNILNSVISSKNVNKNKYDENDRYIDI